MPQPVFSKLQILIISVVMGTFVFLSYFINIIPANPTYPTQMVLTLPQFSAMKFGSPYYLPALFGISVSAFSAVLFLLSSRWGPEALNLLIEIRTGRNTDKDEDDEGAEE